MSRPTGSSYGQMLRSSALLGGSSAINIVLGAVRTKVLAVHLGPALFGVMGLYTTMTTMIQSVASLGLGQSAIREIAAAAESGDQLRVARTIVAYRRIVFLTGAMGLLATLALAYPASLITFRNREHVWAIAALSVVVFFGEIQVGQVALLQGLRRLKDIAALTITGAVLSTVLAIPILLLFRERGIVPFLVSIAAGQLAASWWYARRVPLQAVKITWRETFILSRSMLALGLSFVVSGVGTAVSLYVIRLAISHQLGEAAVGLYQSAFTLSGIYVGFILQAMGGDYYPRLAGLSDDEAGRNLLVNEQSKLAILLATPALVGALLFSDVMIQLFYSSRFAGASDILRWQVLGLVGRIISWPMGFILLARGDSRAFLLSELGSTIIHILLVWVGVRWFGAQGAGMAFAALYVLYFFLVSALVKFRHGYVSMPQTRTIMIFGCAAVGLAFATSFLGDLRWRIGLGAPLLLTTGLICLESLAALVPESRPSKLWRAVRDRLPFSKALARFAEGRRTDRQGADDEER